jgi:predicted MPP superfamily phosphohydrolase
MDIAALTRGTHDDHFSPDPRRLTEAQRSAFRAVLSGHTHGGQVVLPVVGALAQLGRGGHRRPRRTTMFVSRGLRFCLPAGQD